MNSTFLITGTKHGICVTTETEGKARKEFHKEFNGESIIHVGQPGNQKPLQTYLLPWQQSTKYLPF